MSSLLISLGIDRLSPAERLRLIAEIWDSLPEQPPPDLTDEQGQELDRRLALILCRDGLVHLPDGDVLRALDRFRRSGARYLLATTFPAQPANSDIAAGQWRPMNLEKAPFNLPPPLRLVSDGCTVPGYTDKALGLWEVTQLPPAAG